MENSCAISTAENAVHQAGMALSNAYASEAYLTLYTVNSLYQACLLGIEYCANTARLVEEELGKREEAGRLIIEKISAIKDDLLHDDSSALKHELQRAKCELSHHYTFTDPFSQLIREEGLHFLLRNKCILALVDQAKVQMCGAAPEILSRLDSLTAQINSARAQIQNCSQAYLKALQSLSAAAGAPHFDDAKASAA